jgi:hypothetical protein
VEYRKSCYTPAFTLDTDRVLFRIIHTMLQARSQVRSQSEQSIFEVVFGKQRGNIMVNRCSVMDPMVKAAAETYLRKSSV